MSRRSSLALLLILSLALAVPLVSYYAAPDVRKELPAPQKKEPSTITPVRWELQGSGSCSAGVCHGGSDLGKRFSESSTWLSRDPHAQAYDTLLHEKSQAIARNLWGEQARAHEAPLCLKCHVDPNYDRARPTFRKQDGVGCESCHGSAHDWLNDHYREPWQKLAFTEKQKRGMADTKSLPGRARVCISCHIGTPETAVNHDLIAAGHPALRFEFATYLAHLPPHWNVKKDKENNSTKPAQSLDFEARAWLVGQFVSSGTALELLAHRAHPATGTKWPEFAEFDCFSCHHHLQASAWRQKKGYRPGRRLGTFAGSDWYTVLLPSAFEVARIDRADVLCKSLDGLHQRLDSGNAALSSEEGRRQIAQEARELAKAVLEVAQQPQHIALEEPWLDRFGKDRLDRSWDAAVQRYFALLALRQMRKDNRQPDDPALEGLIAKLRDEVAFQPNYDSPHLFVPGK